MKSIILNSRLMLVGLMLVLGGQAFAQSNTADPSTPGEKKECLECKAAAMAKEKAALGAVQGKVLPVDSQAQTACDPSKGAKCAVKADANKAEE